MRFALPLAGLLAVGILAPLAAHLLSRRPPSPRPFPTVRFLRGTPTSARRLRALHDRGLWALRTLIVLVVTVAATGPTLVTASREAAWRPPTVRALIIAPVPGVQVSTAPAPPDARRGSRSDDITWWYTSQPVRQSLAAALADLAERPEAPRDVVIRWDGSRRHLGAIDLAAIPPPFGVRLELTEPAPAGLAVSTNATIAAAADDDAARTFVLGAAPWHASDQPPLVTWPGASSRDTIERDAMPASRRLDEVFRRMRHDPRLIDAAQRSRRDARVTASTDQRLDRARFAPLARSADGEVLLWGAMVGDRMLLVLDARVNDPLALWSVRVADEASRSVDGWPAPDDRWTPAEIAAAQRAPASVAAAPLPAGLDTRWWWLGALALVVLEGLVRRDPTRAGSTATDRAGADGG